MSAAGCISGLAAVPKFPPEARGKLPSALLGKADDPDGQIAVLVSPAYIPGVFLTSSDGSPLMEWPSNYWSAGRARLLEDGSVLRVVVEPAYPKLTKTQSTGGRIEWIGLDGKIRWSHWRNSPEQRVHHDVIVMDVSCVGVLTWNFHPPMEFANRPKAPEKWRREGVWTDGVAVLKPGENGGGKVLAQWDAIDHWGDKDDMADGKLPLGAVVSPTELDVGVYGHCTRLEATAGKLVMFSPVRQETWTLDVGLGSAPSLALSGVHRFNTTKGARCVDLACGPEGQLAAILASIDDSGVTGLSARTIFFGADGVSPLVPPKSSEADPLTLTLQEAGQAAGGVSAVLAGQDIQWCLFDEQTGTGTVFAKIGGTRSSFMFDWPHAIPANHRRSHFAALSPLQLAKVAKGNSADFLKKADSAHLERARVIRGATPFTLTDKNP